LDLENNSTNCAHCQIPLVWTSRTKRWINRKEVDEFQFHCQSCKREYRYREGRLSEILKERDIVAEHKAMDYAEIESASRRRCSECGGPLNNTGGCGLLSCQWCHAQYVVKDGELFPRPEEDSLLKQKPSMSEFYAVYSQR
jgi:hypothetical protein